MPEKRPTPKPIRVLSLEDDEAVRRLLRETLNRHGFVVDVASDVPEGLELLAERPYDVVVIEHKLPSATGLEVLERMQGLTTPTPIIMVTGQGDEMLAVEAMKLGASDYVVKDVDNRFIALLPSVIESAVAKYRVAVERKRALAALRESEERFALAVRGANDGLWDWDLRTGKIYCSPRWHAMLGGGEEETVDAAEDWLAQVHPDDRAALDEAIARHLDRRSPLLAHEYRIRHRDGTWRWMLIRGTAVWDDSGRAYRMAGSQTDVTRQKRAAEELESSNEELRLSLERQQQHHRELVQLNEMSDLLLACRSVEETYPVIARFVAELFPGLSGTMGLVDATGRTVETVAAWGQPLGRETFTLEACWALRRGRLQGGDARPGSLRCGHFDAPYPRWHLCVPMMGRGEVMGHLVLARPAAEVTPGDAAADPGDAAQRLAVTVAGHVALSLSNLGMQESLRRQVIRDPLTHLYNRRFMEESLERELRRSKRQRTPLGVVILDLDHFKRLNDTYGHAAGDAMLRELGELLGGRVRGEDIACRYGGEEFVLILPDTPADGCRRLAEDLRLAIESLRISKLSLTASFGVAAFPEHGQSPDSLLRAADRALYGAKAAGRNCVTVAESVAGPKLETTAAG